MDIAVLLFLTSGLFLGWSLGANDAANVFGTAVGTRMIRFATAAGLCSVFVIIGAVAGGAGAAESLGRLGAVNALPGSFMAALAAAFAVYVMTKAGLAVSTTQAIVGAIVGWNLFSESLTDSGALTKILSTWLICPVLAAGIAIPLYWLTRRALQAAQLHLLRVDSYTRLGLVLAGMFGAYSLGANNIANVVGVFVPASPFTEFSMLGMFSVSSVQQLFMLGALAIGAGVITYSKRVMFTVGSGLLPLSPVAAWVAVMSHSLVLFLFASEGLESLLARYGLPTIPLVPVSSSQAVVGAIVGIGLMQGGQHIRWRLLGSIGLGWVATPLIAGLICFIGLFFLQNVFGQRVFREVPYVLSAQVLQRLGSEGISSEPLGDLRGRRFTSAAQFRKALAQEEVRLDSGREAALFKFAEMDEMRMDVAHFERMELGTLSSAQQLAVTALAGRTFPHRWMLAEALARETAEWRLPPDSPAQRQERRRLAAKLNFVYRTFRSAK
ncbi:MAG: inorganic phosphate transporter [SAR324 cluster bacterium]|nr:inorganic phosphate transporter [SAR324 cluster bacterium]MCZ6532390.1 inorganic phosphate transporter [SAR324 cluster bacterium]MCZ6627399.1 inorganic phosphate transporter [SAR324 cluster bacterium]MCZ6841406.1 inorganic phosphate transporter [SAR324 cluster bacterium]